MFAIFLKGMLIGIAIAAPVGPIGILCIRKTLTHGKLSGFVSGMGAAFADACYGAVAAFGLVAITQFITEYTMVIRAAGGIFLLYLGVKIIRQAPLQHGLDAELSEGSKKNTWKMRGASIKDFISTFLLTLSNPSTIVSFLAIFAGLGITGYKSLPALVMVSGVLLGSGGWWLVLSLGIGSVKHKISGVSILYINWLSGAMMIVFAVSAFISLFY